MEPSRIQVTLAVYYDHQGNDYSSAVRFGHRGHISTTCSHHTNLSAVSKASHTKNKFDIAHDEVFVCEHTFR
jgi:hypothetical protein